MGLVHSENLPSRYFLSINVEFSNVVFCIRKAGIKLLKANL